MKFNFSNKNVFLCAPVENAGVPEGIVRGGIAQFRQKKTIIGLSLLFDGIDPEQKIDGNDVISAGTVIYVKEEDLVQQWGKNVLILEGKDVILVPRDVVIGFGSKD